MILIKNCRTGKGESFPKKSHSILRKGTRFVIYPFIDENKNIFGLRWLFRHFHIAPNAYYNYLKNNKNGYRKQKQKILEEIKSIYYNHNRIIGHRGMKILLARKGIHLSKTTVCRYMNQELNLHAVTMRKKQTYVRGEKNKIFPNLLKQNFTADAKNKVWCTDFTYIRLSNGKMRYNCTIMDLYDRSVVATLNSSCINTELAVDTLKRAINNEKTGAGLITRDVSLPHGYLWIFANPRELSRA